MNSEITVWMKSHAAVIMSAFSLIVSIFTFIWNVGKEFFFRKRNSRIEIEVGIVTEFSINFIMGAQSNLHRVHFKIKITNTGYTKCHIDNLLLRMPRKADSLYGMTRNIPLNQLMRGEWEDQFPIVLEEGQTHTYDFNAADLCQSLFLFHKLKDTDSIKILVQDTLGNTYSSQKIDIKELKNHFKDIPGKDLKSDANMIINFPEKTLQEKQMPA